jgi:hypothetical protein
MLNFKKILVIFTLLALVVIAQAIIHKNYGSRIITGGKAFVVDWAERGGEVEAILEFENGEKVETRNVSIIVNYLRNPRPLDCRLYEGGRVECVNER